MNCRAIVVIAFAWALSLVSAGVWAQSATAPVSRVGQDPTAVTTVPSGMVASGAALGFRVTGPVDATGKVPGVFVVKINGRWVEVSAK